MPGFFRPQAVRGRLERRSHLGELERADNPTAVVRVETRGSRGVPRGQELVRALGSEPVVGPFPALARGAGRPRW